MLGHVAKQNKYNFSITLKISKSFGKNKRWFISVWK